MSTDTRAFPVLKYKVGTEEHVYEIKGDCTVGRRPENDITLNDPSVSREHARITVSGDEVRIKDSGSFNGTRVNGTPVKDYPLLHGDRVTIENFELMFLAAGSDPEISARGDVTFTINEHTQYEVQLNAGAEDLFEGEAVEDLKKANRNLKLIHSVAAEMCELMESDVLLGKVMGILREIYNPDQAAILIADKKGDNLVPAITHQGEQGQELSVSKTITDEVKSKRVAVLCNDLMGDARFAAAQSIISTGIASTMCTPLIAKEKFLGIIYLTSFEQNPRFDAEGLELLLGLSSQAAVGIENNRLQEQIAEELVVRNNLKRYMSAPLVEGLVNNEIDLNPGGLKREVTCLFSDIKGFTTLSEELPPERVVELLNEYFEQMVDAIFETNGTLDKYAGDGIMAVWGNLVPVDNHAQSAVRSGLLMLEKVKALNDQRRSDNKPEFLVRIGINTGVAVCGNIGSSRRMEFTVIGDTVNVAARLETAAAPGTVLISEKTYQAVKDEITAKAHGEIVLKGKASAVPAYVITL